MRLRKQFQQLQLWRQPYAPGGVELPASRRRELTAALADLLWQFARATAHANQEQEGCEGYAEHDQDHA